MMAVNSVPAMYLLVSGIGVYGFYTMLFMLYYNCGTATTVIIVTVAVHLLTIHWQVFQLKQRITNCVNINLEQKQNQNCKNESGIKCHQENMSIQDTGTNIPTAIEDINNQQCIEDVKIIDYGSRKSNIQSLSKSSMPSRMPHRTSDGAWKKHDTLTPRLCKGEGQPKERRNTEIRMSCEGLPSETMETEVKARIPTKMRVHNHTNVAESVEELQHTAQPADLVGSQCFIEADIEEDGPDGDPTKYIDSCEMCGDKGSSVCPCHTDSPSSDVSDGYSSQSGFHKDHYFETLIKEIGRTNDVRVKEIYSNDSGYLNEDIYSTNILADHIEQQPLDNPLFSFKGDMKVMFGIDLREDNVFPDSAEQVGLSLRDLMTDESYVWKNLSSYGYEDIPEDAFHMIQSDGTGNRPIYEELKRIDWVMGYFSQGDSIEVYIDLDDRDPTWYHQHLCSLTGQPEHKFRVVDNEHKWSI